MHSLLLLSSARSSNSCLNVRISTTLATEDLLRQRRWWCSSSSPSSSKPRRARRMGWSRSSCRRTSGLSLLWLAPEATSGRSAAARRGPEIELQVVAPSRMFEQVSTGAFEAYGASCSGGDWPVGLLQAGFRERLPHAVQAALRVPSCGHGALLPRGQIARLA